jgi:hypothetical protein
MESDVPRKPRPGAPYKKQAFRDRGLRNGGTIALLRQQPACGDESSDSAEWPWL